MSVESQLRATEGSKHNDNVKDHLKDLYTAYTCYYNTFLMQNHIPINISYKMGYKKESFCSTVWQVINDWTKSENLLMNIGSKDTHKDLLPQTKVKKYHSSEKTDIEVDKNNLGHCIENNKRTLKENNREFIN